MKIEHPMRCTVHYILSYLAICIQWVPVALLFFFFFILPTHRPWLTLATSKNNTIQSNVIDMFVNFIDESFYVYDGCRTVYTFALYETLFYKLNFIHSFDIEKNVKGRNINNLTISKRYATHTY